MPRIPRNLLDTSYFHVITQGINRSYIFNNENDIKYYIQTMYKLKNEYNINIIAYCIMNNHAHFLIQVQSIEQMSKYMQRLNAKYGIFYNKKYNRVGYVFRDRYKSEGIYSEEQLYNCIKYIFENPVKAGMCKQASDYPYSNYRKIDFISIKEYKYIDVCEEENIDFDTIIKKFLNDKKITLDDLKNDKLKLGEIIEILKSKYKFSLRKISINLNINREKIRNLYNK